jgi:hypothetical protein
MNRNRRPTSSLPSTVQSMFEKEKLVFKIRNFDSFCIQEITPSPLTSISFQDATFSVPSLEQQKQKLQQQSQPPSNFLQEFQSLSQISFGNKKETDCFGFSFGTTAELGYSFQ